MPYGDYNPHKIMKVVQTRHARGETVRQMKVKHEQEVAQKEVDLKMHKSKLKVHEDREKRRMDGLKKAQQARKKVTKKK